MMGLGCPPSVQELLWIWRSCLHYYFHPGVEFLILPLFIVLAQKERTFKQDSQPGRGALTNEPLAYWLL